MITIDNENWLTRQEVIETLGCSGTLTSYLNKTNKLPFVRVRGRMRCREDDFIRYLESVKNKGISPPFTNIMLDWDESCKFLYSYKPQSPYYPYFTPSLKYLVSNKGRIFNVDYTRELSQYKDGMGYYQVTITGRNGEPLQLLVNRLVAGVWCPNYHNKPHVHHINRDKTDNHYHNLLWVTELEHRNLHNLLKNKKRREYKALVDKIRADNAYPERWENGVSIIDPDANETENCVNFLHLTKRGFEKYKKKGKIDPREILREVAFAKKNPSRKQLWSQNKNYL